MQPQPTTSPEANPETRQNLILGCLIIIAIIVLLLACVGAYTILAALTGSPASSLAVNTTPSPASPTQPLPSSTPAPPPTDTPPPTALPPSPTPTATFTPSPLVYRVIEGDNIWTIATKFKVDPAALIFANNLDPADPIIHPNQPLAIPGLAADSLSLAGIAPCLPSNTQVDQGLVTHIIDGDTIDVRIGDQTYRVRYIGIDTPENTTQVEPYGQEAARYNTSLVYNQTVTLVKDVSETDRYDRLLRYVLVGPLFVNYELVANGYANPVTYPAALALTALWFSRQERKDDRKAAEERAKVDRQIAADRTQEASLQTYLDRMTELLLKDDLRQAAAEDEVRTIARARTLATLRTLDPNRKGALLRFLHEARLLERNEPIINLSGAELSYADLSEANLNGANLSKANLLNADLCRTYLGGAYLSGAYLNGADLTNAIVTPDQLAQTFSLKGATLPDGTLHK